MKISDMDAIIKVVQLKGLSAAADALFVSQPALSQLIRRVESELGITLFVRQQGRAFELTQDGKRFLDMAEQVTHIYQDYLLSLKSDAHVLRIGISAHFGHRIVQAVFNSDPELSRIGYSFSEIVSGTKREQALLDREIDVAIVRTPIVTPGILHKVVYHEGLGIWLRNGSPAESQAVYVPGHRYRVLPISALNGEPLALPSPDSRMHQSIDRMLTLHQIHPASVQSFRNMSYILMMVEQGVYSTISYYPKEAQNTDRFFIMDPCDVTYDLAAAYRPGTKHLPAIEKLCRMLSIYFQRMNK